MKLLYACDACRYLFESETEETQCPDCGKLAVRPAVQDEIEEYENRQVDWDEEDEI